MWPRNTEDRRLGRACQKEGDTHSRARLLPVAEGKGQPGERLTEGESPRPWQRPGVPGQHWPGCPTSAAPRPSQVPSAGLQDKIPGSNCIFWNQATFKLLPETYNLYVRRFIYLLFLGHKRRNSPVKPWAAKARSYWNCIISQTRDHRSLESHLTEQS